MSDERRVLVVAAHPDDEVLGCGGTVALHTGAGDRVWSLIACEGESMRYADEAAHQDLHTERARDTLGVERVVALGLPDQCKKRIVACKKRIVACKKRIVTGEKRNVACKKRSVACRKRIVACKKRSVACKKRSVAGEKRSV